MEAPLEQLRCTSRKTESCSHGTADGLSTYHYSAHDVVRTPSKVCKESCYLMSYTNSRRAAWLGAILGVIVAAIPAVAADFSERFERTYPVAASVRVSLSNVNGSVEIAGWDRNQVQVVATKHADSKEKLARLRIDVEAGSETVAIKTKLPDWPHNDSGSVEYEIHVPRGAKLDQIHTVNGSVEITGVGDAVHASSVNGQVTGRELTGDIDLSTVNGNVDCEVIDLAAARNAKLSAVSGGVELSMPRDANAHLSAHTVNGTITSNLNLPVKSGFVGSNLDTTLGSGTTRVELKSVNGGISIHGGSKGL